MSVAVEVQYPKKLFYKINEVSRITGIKPYVLRYWETEFNQLKPQKDVNEQRRYRQSDIDLIREIKRLLYEERFTIAGARVKLKTAKGISGRNSAHKVSHRRKIKAITKDIMSIRKELNTLLERYA